MMILPLALVAALGSEPTDTPLAFESLSDFVAQDEAMEEEPKGWTGTINGMVTRIWGNSQIKRYSLGIDATKRVDENRYTVGSLYTYASEDGDISERKAFVSGQYDRFLNEKSYLYGMAAGKTDDEANVDLGYTAGVGYGRQILDDDEWKLNTEIGVNYVYEEFDRDDIADEQDVDKGSVDKDNDYLAARLAYGAEWNYSERWQFSQKTAVIPSFDDPTDDVYARVDTRAILSLTENMLGQLQYLFEWDNSPAEGSERADHTVLITVGWKF